MPIRLEKIIIFCADVDKLVTFYQDCFHLTLVGEADSNWTVLNAGQTHLAFHKIGAEYLPQNTEDFKIQDSNVKLVFEIDSDLHSFRQKLIDEEVDVRDIRQFPGYPYIMCDGNDPEGNVFQIIQMVD